MHTINSPHKYTEHHVDYSNNDCEFHLERVDECQIICWVTPNRVNTKIISAVIIFSYMTAGICLFHIIARSEQVQRQTRKFIVDQPAVNCEESHEKNYIPSFKKRFKSAFRPFPYFITKSYQIGSKQKQ